jgi:SAM-dependent methyltransferase
MQAEHSHDLPMKLGVIRELGLSIDPGASVLDFGCGRGTLVAELRRRGHRAFGCDIELWQGDPDAQSMRSKGWLREVESGEYRLPFEDNTFDVVLSDQVFEHVQNYREVVRELARVVRPHGFCLHIFPSRYIFIEPHVYVPLATVLRSRAWLYLWAMLGVHNEFQGTASSKDGTNAREIADFNYRYLRSNVNYLSKSALMREFRHGFDDVRFCEREFLANSKGGRFIYEIAKVLPFLPALFSTFRSRVVLTQAPKKNVVRPLAGKSTVSAQAESLSYRRARRGRRRP